MLRQLVLRGSRIDRPVHRLHDDIRSPAVFQRITKFELQLIAGHHFVDVQRFGVLIEIVRHQLRLALIGQPDQSDVIVLDPTARTLGAIVAGVRDDLGRLAGGAIGHDADEIGEMSGFRQFRVIDGRLTVLRRHNHERRIVETGLFQGIDELP